MSGINRPDVCSMKKKSLRYGIYEIKTHVSVFHRVLFDAARLRYDAIGRRMTYCGQKLRDCSMQCPSASAILRVPRSNEKAFVCYSFPGRPFLAVFSSMLFVAYVEPLLTQYRVTFICERRDDARHRLSVLFKAGGSHVSVGNE